MVQAYKSVQTAYNPNIGINRAMYPSNAKNSVQGAPLITKGGGSSSGGSGGGSSGGNSSGGNSSGGSSSGRGDQVFGAAGINQIGNSSIGSRYNISNLGVLNPGQYSNYGHLTSVGDNFKVTQQQLITILDGMNISYDKQKQVLSIYKDMGINEINTQNVQQFIKKLFTTTLNVDEISSLVDRFIYLKQSSQPLSIPPPPQSITTTQQPQQQCSQQPIIIQAPPPIIIQQQVPQVVTQPQVQSTSQVVTQHQVQSTPQVVTQTQCNMEIKKVTNYDVYPWIASIGTNTIKHVQTGVLIGSKWILTNVNTLEISLDDYIVKIGGINLDNDGEFVVRQVVNIIPHTLYNVWLMELSSEVNSIKPIDINATNVKFHSGIEIGWGKLTGDGKNTGVLRELEIPFLPRQQCSVFDEKFINNVHLCGGYPQCSTLLPCTGDTGSPLLVKFGDRVLLHGISDLNINCEQQNTGLGLWISITSILSWLQRYVNGTSIVDTSYMSKRERSDDTSATPRLPQITATIKPGTTIVKSTSPPTPIPTVAPTQPTPRLIVAPTPTVIPTTIECSIQQQQNYMYIFLLLVVFTILGIGLFLF